MSALKTKKAGVIIFVGLLLFILAWGTWKSLAGQSLEEWIKTKDEPVVERLNRAFDLFTQKRYGEASVEFSKAYELAETVDKEAEVKWQDKIKDISPPRKFYNDPPGARSRGGLSYFKNRMSEAGYGLASSIYWQVLDKYHHRISLSASGSGPRFTPPASELQPALDVINKTLTITPQSENLRILKSEILTLLGAYADAVSVLDEVLLINSESAEAYNQLGIIYSSPPYMNSEEYEMYREKSLAMFEKAALLKDSNGKFLADPHYNLGMYYAIPPSDKPETAMPTKQDAARALQHLSRFLELSAEDNPLRSEVQAIVTKLKKIAE